MSNIAIQFTWRHTHCEKTIEKEHIHDAIEIVYYIRGEGTVVVNNVLLESAPYGIPASHQLSHSKNRAVR